MCIALITHHSCWHKTFTLSPTNHTCNFQIHVYLSHKYTQDRCNDCKVERPEDFKAFSVNRVRKIFYDLCENHNHPMMQEVLHYYQFHSTPGHTCKAPFHCYGNSAEAYYEEYPREAWDYALMPSTKNQSTFAKSSVFDNRYQDSIDDYSMQDTTAVWEPTFVGGGKGMFSDNGVEENNHSAKKHKGRDGQAFTTHWSHMYTGSFGHAAKKPTTQKGGGKKPSAPQYDPFPKEW